MRATPLLTKPMHFTMSKYDEDRKLELGALITRLGGVVDEEFVARTTTHLVVPVPSRSLKYLLACASGCWVLRESFVEESVRAGEFVDEREHEWSSDGLPEGAVQTEEKYVLAEAPRKMRKRRERGEAPPLHGIACAFLGPPEKNDTYQQLASVLGATIKYSGLAPDWRTLGSRVSHVFCASAYTLQAADVAAQRTHGLQCHLAEWIVQVILRGKPPKANEYPARSGKGTRRNN